MHVLSDLFVPVILLVVGQKPRRPKATKAKALQLLHLGRKPRDTFNPFFLIQSFHSLNNARIIHGMYKKFSTSKRDTPIYYKTIITVIAMI